MLVTKPYLLYREHMKIKAQGYQGIGANGGRLSGDGNDEEGEGNVMLAEDMEEEHVSLLS